EMPEQSRCGLRALSLESSMRRARRWQLFAAVLFALPGSLVAGGASKQELKPQLRWGQTNATISIEVGAPRGSRLPGCVQDEKPVVEASFSFDRVFVSAACGALEPLRWEFELREDVVPEESRAERLAVLGDSGLLLMLRPRPGLTCTWTRALGRTVGEPTVGAVLASLADAGLLDKEEAPLAALEAGILMADVADVVMMDAAASTPVTRQAQEIEMTRAFREVAGRMVDMRGVAKPPNFTGLETDWAEWKFRMEAILSLLGLDDLAEAAVREGVDADARLLSDADELRSKMLYNLLVQLCSGKALSLVRTVRRADGLGSWAKLVREYEPSVAARHCAMLSFLLCPGFEDSKPFTEQLLEWERRITDYELVTKAMFPDAYKCAVISRWAPKRVREFLRVNTSDLTASYGELKRALRDLQVRSQTFDAAGQGSQDQHSEYVPMIVDALKGLGKWKTATKTDECHNCGKKGHFARDCRSQPKDKAKGKSKCTDRKGGGKAGQGQWPQGPRDQGQQKQPEHQGAQGKGKGQAFDGKCFQCGKEGHRARDCRQKPIAELAEPEPHPLDGQDSQSWFMMLAETA
ncbi:unnamed protein product, partial [Polarella glacialis]